MQTDRVVSRKNSTRTVKMINQMSDRGLDGASPALQRPPIVVFSQNSANVSQITFRTPIGVLALSPESGVDMSSELSYILSLLVR